MAEEKIDEIQEPTMDDVDMLRMVLYKVRGVSPISTITHNQSSDEE
jgi:hypothetical protein